MITILHSLNKAEPTNGTCLIDSIAGFRFSRHLNLRFMSNFNLSYQDLCSA